MQDLMALPREYYVALAAVVAAVVWFIANTGNPSPPVQRPKPTQRDELIETRDRIRRQIEILKSPMRSGDYTSLSQQAVERLQAVLEEIEDELKDSKP